MEVLHRSHGDGVPYDHHTSKQLHINPGLVGATIVSLAAWARPGYGHTGQHGGAPPQHHRGAAPEPAPGPAAALRQAALHRHHLHRQAVRRT
eukprot:1152307-Pelagomonas_calceolata.AAC.7